MIWIAVVVGVGILIVIHELGHFLAAKLLKVEVLEFSIGFGPAIAKWTRNETQYALRIIPLGGYVKLAGLDGEKKGYGKEYFEAPLTGRLAIIGAGPVANYVLAVLLFGIVGTLWGIPKIAGPVVGGVLPGFPAEQAGILPGDRILAVNGKVVSSWDEPREAILSSGGNTVPPAGERGGGKLTIEVKPKKSGSGWVIGIVPKVTLEKGGPISSLVEGIRSANKYVLMITSSVIRVISRASIGEVAGPVGIFQVTAQAAKSGLPNFIWFIGFLSINLMIFNLLPWPPLDGGRIVLLPFEAFLPKEKALRLEEYVSTAGFVILMLLFVLITKNDIARVLRK